MSSKGIRWQSSWRIPVESPDSAIFILPGDLGVSAMNSIDTVSTIQRAGALLVGLCVCIGSPQHTWADGLVKAPRNYAGSLEESSQEAMIVFEAGQGGHPSRQTLVLKIQVDNDQPLNQLAWVVPFPVEPEIHEAPTGLFKELFDYVEARKRARSHKPALGAKTAADNAMEAEPDAVVLSRKIVGSYDVAVVEEKRAGGLNRWLEENGFQTLDTAETALQFYREKGYVFVCLKFDEAQLAAGSTTELHPLAFQFSTGGEDGIYFPMKLTAAQDSPVDINLYVFYRYWLNDDLNRFGYRHRGFELHYRDWDSPECVANGGKAYTAPASDPFLKRYRSRFPTVTRFLQAGHPGQRFYLTNIQAHGVEPDWIGRWKDDLWLYPYYTNRRRIPQDVQAGGPAAGGWPELELEGSSLPIFASDVGYRGMIVGLLVLAVLVGAAAGFWFKQRRGNRFLEEEQG